MMDCMEGSIVKQLCVMLYVSLFFFKQKTAYEMRISDWSSDVCSSDLAIAQGSLTWQDEPAARRSDSEPIRLQSIQHGLHLRGLPRWKIGRASCRERVCQYV